MQGNLHHPQEMGKRSPTIKSWCFCQMHRWMINVKEWEGRIPRWLVVSAAAERGVGEKGFWWKLRLLWEWSCSQCGEGLQGGWDQRPLPPPPPFPPPPPSPPPPLPPDPLHHFWRQEWVTIWRRVGADVKHICFNAILKLQVLMDHVISGIIIMSCSIFCCDNQHVWGWIRLNAGELYPT